MCIDLSKFNRTMRFHKYSPPSDSLTVMHFWYLPMLMNKYFFGVFLCALKINVELKYNNDL